MARLPSRFRERPLVHPHQQLGNGLVDFREREELALAQSGHDPALDYLNPHLRFGFVPGPIPPRRNDRHAIVLTQIPVGRVQIRFVVAGMRDGGLQIVGHHDFCRTAEKLEGSHMRTDPVPQVLPGGSLREGVTAGAQYRREHGGGLYFTALRVVNRYRGSGVIDEHLLAGAVLLPQHQVELFQPSPVEVAVPAVAVAFRVALPSFLPDQL